MQARPRRTRSDARRRGRPGDPGLLIDHGLAAIRKASRHHARDVRELVVDALDDDQLAQLGEVSAALFAALRAQEARRG